MHIFNRLEVMRQNVCGKLVFPQKRPNKCVLADIFWFTPSNVQIDTYQITNQNLHEICIHLRPHLNMFGKFQSNFKVLKLDYFNKIDLDLQSIAKTRTSFLFMKKKTLSMFIKKTVKYTFSMKKTHGFTNTNSLLRSSLIKAEGDPSVFSHLLGSQLQSSMHSTPCLLQLQLNWYHYFLWNDKFKFSK